MIGIVGTNWSTLRWRCGLLEAGAVVAVLGRVVVAQTDPSGIDFVTIGSPGNAAWTGGGENNNRGAVGYAYRMSREEVTTAQWVEFFNDALDRPAADRIPHVFAPEQWGAVATTPINPGGQRFTVPAGGGMIPTGGVDWRTCAIFCNWLCNGRSTARSAFLNGAYDVSTFGFYLNGPTFTDQLTHNPGAQYWIPSLDEWMKAAHYDPNRNGPGQGGWWNYSNSSDAPYVYGPPGVLVNGQPTTANAAWDDLNFPGYNPYAVPLGAYPTVMSPWGLLDVGGGTSEWTEEAIRIQTDTYPRWRVFDGSHWGPETAGFSDTAGYRYSAQDPTYFGYEVGLRVAAAIPAPASVIPLVLIACAGARRRRSAT
jgi:hypothetical protein